MNFAIKLRQISGGWYFLAAVLLVYFILFFIKRRAFNSGINIFFDLLKKIAPVFAIVFILMMLTNYFITPKIIIDFISRGKFKKWFFAVAGGILSSGPIYMWYPLLADLRKKGLSNGLIACFLYNRAIKIPLLPVAALYFGWMYVAALSCSMVFFSILQGIIVDKIMDV